MNAENKDYFGMFNLTKGIFIIGVILIHCVTNFFPYWDLLDQITFRPLLVLFAPFGIFQYGLVPTFFCISGYWFSKRSFKRMFKNETWYFLKAYLIIMLLITFGKLLFMQNPNGYNAEIILKEAVKTIAFASEPTYGGFGGHEVQGIGTLYFLIVYVNAGLLYNLILHLKSTASQNVAIISSVFAGLFLSGYVLPFCLPQSLLAVGFLHMGRRMHEKKVLHEHLPVAYLLFMIIYICVEMTNGYVDFSQNVWRNGIYDFIAVCFSAILLMYFFYNIEKRTGHALNFVRIIGKNSFWALCAHIVEKQMLPWEEWAKWMAGCPVAGFMLMILAQGLLTFAGTVLIYKLAKQKVRRKRGIV